jgi:excisionase family DNA binding protein
MSGGTKLLTDAVLHCKDILRYSSVARIGTPEDEPVRVRFLLDKCRTCGTMEMKYSVSNAAELLGIDRRTLQRWVSRKKIPAPTAGIVEGRLVKFWTEADMKLLKEHKAATYGGKGLDRRTGKKAKQQES